MVRREFMNFNGSSMPALIVRSDKWLIESKKFRSLFEVTRQSLWADDGLFFLDIPASFVKSHRRYLKISSKQQQHNSPLLLINRAQAKVSEMRWVKPRKKVRRVQLGKCLKYNKSISAELEKNIKKTTRVEKKIFKNKYFSSFSSHDHHHHSHPVLNLARLLAKWRKINWNVKTRSENTLLQFLQLYASVGFRYCVFSHFLDFLI